MVNIKKKYAILLSVFMLVSGMGAESPAPSPRAVSRASSIVPSAGVRIQLTEAQKQAFETLIMSVGEILSKHITAEMEKEYSLLSDLLPMRLRTAQDIAELWQFGNISLTKDLHSNAVILNFGSSVFSIDCAKQVIKGYGRGPSDGYYSLQGSMLIVEVQGIRKEFNLADDAAGKIWELAKTVSDATPHVWQKISEFLGTVSSSITDLRNTMNTSLNTVINAATELKKVIDWDQH